MEELNLQRWEGKVSVEIRNLTADQAWSLLQDFFSICKWLPSVTTSCRVEGTDGELGCIRYCAGTSVCSDDGYTVSWTNEKLVAIDQIERIYSYEVVDGNIGFGNYVATMKVVSDSNENGEEEGCRIEWSFMADPIEGWSEDGLLSYLEFNLQGMARRMKEALLYHTS